MAFVSIFQNRRAVVATLAVLALPLTAFGERLDRAQAARMVEQPHAEGRFIVKFRERTTNEQISAERLSPYAGTAVEQIEGIGEGQNGVASFYVLRLPKQTGQLGRSQNGRTPTGRGGEANPVEVEALERLSQHPDIEYIEPDYTVQVEALSTDPLFAQQWALKNTNGADIAATTAWDISKGSAKNIVAVLDTGVDVMHPDLTANLWKSTTAFTYASSAGNVSCPAGTTAFNAISNVCVPAGTVGLDDNGHGTHCAGIIGATGNNAVGVTGINWTAAILPVKFLDAKGSGSLSGALRAIDFVVQLKKSGVNVRVISASWGFGAVVQSLDEAIGNANAADILFVAAAGNAAANNDLTASYPANSPKPNVISVAATDRNDALASFSNYGKAVHLGAPGVSIASTLKGGQYGNMSGTSMATPYVAGTAALVLSSCTLNTATLKQYLLETVDPLASLTGKTATGGRLNAYRALRRCATPSVTLSATATSSTVVAGTGTSYSLSAAVTGGVTGTGTLTITGVPAGVTLAFPPTVTMGAPITVTVNTLKTAVAATYKLTATVAAGTLRATLPLTLVVQPAPVVAQFKLAATVPATPVQPGAKVNVALQVTRATGFTGPVTVNVAGATATAVVLAAGQATVSMPITVPATAQFGSLNLVFTATGGTPSASTTAPLVVTVAKTFTLTFAAPTVSAKAGTNVALPFTLKTNGPLPTGLSFQLAGLPSSTTLSLTGSTTTGQFTLNVLTKTTWPTTPISLTMKAVAGTDSASGTVKVTLTK